MKIFIPDRINVQYFSLKPWFMLYANHKPWLNPPINGGINTTSQTNLPIQRFWDGIGKGFKAGNWETDSSIHRANIDKI